MGKKYLDTKEGSLEQSVLGVWQTAIEEGDARRTKSEKLVGGQKKLDKDKDGDIDGKDFAMLRKSAKKDKKEEVELDEAVKVGDTVTVKLNRKGKEYIEKGKVIKIEKDSIIVKHDFSRTPSRVSMKNIVKEEVEESYEIGTDEYRKHTEDVTPGENGEWTKLVNQKSQSMREALAKVWGVDEGKSPFKKEEKKENKTMTGKKVASVDINPTIKEKTK